MPRRGAKHPAEDKSTLEELLLALPLPGPQRHRAHVRADQGLSTDRHPLRQARPQLPLRRLPSRYRLLLVMSPEPRLADDSRAWNKKWVEKKNRISAIEFKGLISFFQTNQNTVALHCVFPEVQELWYKPDYPQGAPHLTLYDGESRQFARRVLEVLGRFEWNFEVSATPLRPLSASERECPYLC